MKRKPTTAPKAKQITVHIAGGFVSRTFFRALQEKDATISEFMALGYLTSLFEAGEITCKNVDDENATPIYQMAKAVTIQI